MVVIYFSGIANGNNTLQISCFCRRYNDGFGDVVIEAPKSRPGGGGGVRSGKHMWHLAGLFLLPFLNFLL